MESNDVAGLLATALFFTIAILFYLSHRRTSQLEHEERLRMIEKGMAPPPRTNAGWPGVKQQEQQLRFDERRVLIEKGLVPPSEDAKRWQPEDFRRRGVLTLFVGIGLGITYFTVGISPIPETALIRAWLAFGAPVLTFFGIGCLVYYRAAKGRPDGSGPARS